MLRSVLRSMIANLSIYLGRKTQRPRLRFCRGHQMWRTPLGRQLTRSQAHSGWSLGDAGLQLSCGIPPPGTFISNNQPQEARARTRPARRQPRVVVVTAEATSCDREPGPPRPKHRWWSFPNQHDLPCSSRTVFRKPPQQPSEEFSWGFNQQASQGVSSQAGESRHKSTSVAIIGVHFLIHEVLPS